METRAQAENGIGAEAANDASFKSQLLANPAAVCLKLLVLPCQKGPMLPCSKKLTKNITSFSQLSPLQSLRKS